MKRTRNDYEPAFFDIHAVSRRYNVRTVTIYKWMQEGRFPQPLRLTPGCSRWSLDDLKTWEQTKRDEAAPRPEWEERRRRQQMKEAKRH